MPGSNNSYTMLFLMIYLSLFVGDTQSSDDNFYDLTPSKIGVVITGINLMKDHSHDVINRIKDDVITHSLLIFKNQAQLTPERHVEISRWFGDLDLSYTHHPQAPDKHILRVSNLEEEGRTRVGSTSWHIDGSYMKQPSSHALYHIIKASSRGATEFVSLYDVVSGLTPETHDRWNRLWQVILKTNNPVQPLLYNHPVNNKQTLLVFTNKTERFIWDYGSDQERTTEDEETRTLIGELEAEITRNDGELVYAHLWEEGDFIITDNLALCHKAGRDTQIDSKQIGIRVLDRVTVQGTSRPTKTTLAELLPSQPADKEAERPEEKADSVTQTQSRAEL